jgi:hypothetical protein
MSTAPLLAAGLAAALWSFGQPLAPPPQLAIMMKFDVPPPSAVLEAMQHEVTKIFEPAGIQLAWRWLEQNDGSELFSHVVVLRFRGMCRTLPASLTELQPFIDDLELANATVREGQALPFAEVHCDRVSAFSRPWRKAEQAATLGVAMGRVIAHELYHMLTNTLTHGIGTLSKASVTSQELAWGAARFSPDEIELVKQSVR